MKKKSFATLAILSTAAMAASASASTLIYEPFSYTSGQAIAGQNNTTSAQPETWWDAGTVGSTVHQVGTPGLTSPTGFPAATGNMADLKGGTSGGYTEYDRINIPNAFNGNATAGYTAAYAGGSTLYYSLLLNVPANFSGTSIAGMGTAANHTNPNENNDGLIAFNNVQGSQAGRPSAWNGELVIRKGAASDTFNLGVRGSTTTAGTTYFTGDLTPGQTYLIVVEAQINATDTDGTNSLWVNPSAASYGALTAPAPNGSSNGIGSNAGTWNMESLLIGAGIASGAAPTDTYMDEIRVGTTWADVTSVPAAVPLPAAAGGGMLLLAGLAGSSAYRRRRMR